MREVICFMGPTASGKTDMACKLIEHFPCEIISVDSAMVYLGMNIGTAKPNEALLSHAPHHLLDIREPTEAYSAAAFCDDASRLCDEILARGKIPLLVGGSMMYFRALQDGLSKLPEADATLRQTLLDEANEKGWPALHQKLKAVDPVTAKRLHPNDAQRIQRALEVYHVTGTALSKLLETTDETKAPYQFVNIILFPERRAWLHERIVRRFDEMLALGFLDEVEGLLKRFELTLDMPSMRSVGYRQALNYLQGACDYKTFREQAVAATRQLAKRQLTWLRSWPEAYRFDPESSSCFTEVLELLHSILDNRAYEEKESL